MGDASVLRGVGVLGGGGGGGGGELSAGKFDPLFTDVSVHVTLLKVDERSEMFDDATS